MAQALVSAFQNPVGSPKVLDEVTLIPSDGGCFEIVVDDELLYSKRATRQHIATEQAVQIVREYLRRHSPGGT